MYVPKIALDGEDFDLEQFQILKNILNEKNDLFSIDSVSHNSEIYNIVKKSFEIGKDQEIQNQIVKQYLLKAQNKLFSLSESKNMLKNFNNSRSI
jgi:hypothetical protein